MPMLLVLGGIGGAISMTSHILGGCPETSHGYFSDMLMPKSFLMTITAKFIGA